MTLTVTDNGGLTGSANHPVTVSAANVSPTAAFTTSCTNLACTFTDQSSDPDQTSASLGRSWNYGDNTSGTTASHTYATAGTYTVTLTVTDNGGIDRHRQPPGHGQCSQRVSHRRVHGELHQSQLHLHRWEQRHRRIHRKPELELRRQYDLDGHQPEQDLHGCGDIHRAAHGHRQSGRYRYHDSERHSHAAPAPPPPSSIALTVTKKASTTLSYALLDWTGATGDSVEVFRNSTPGGALLKIARTENDGHMGSTRSNVYEPITYTFQLCQKGQAPGQTGAVCSNKSSQTFP